MNDLETTGSFKEYLSRWFGFPKNKVFAQVTTLTGKQPHIRTMDLYHVTDRGGLIFTTDTQSPKWQQLHECSNVAICLLNLDQGQIIIEGSAKLDTCLTNPCLASLYWHNYLNQYWRDFYLKNNSGDLYLGIPAVFGIMQITPISWEFLEINSDDFLEGSRVKYERQNDVWVCNSLMLR